MDYDAAVKALYQQMIDSISGKENAAVISAVEKLGPSIDAAFASEDVTVAIDATFDTQSFLESLDFESLSAETKGALIAMLQGLKIPASEQYVSVFGGGNPFQVEIDRLINSLMVDGSSGGGGYKIGAQFGQGFANGMRSKISEVIRAGESLTTAAKKAMRQGLMIQSPSKVAAEFGAYFSEGFANGIINSANLASRAAAGLANGAINALNGPSISTMTPPQSVSTPIQGAVSQGNTTLELVVDGEKLGKVAIKNINDIQRRTGRAILNLGG
jgi:hypothetical protein